MKKILSIVILLSLSSFAFSDVGIGISARLEDREVYFPIDFKDRYRIEPSISIIHVESTGGYTQDSSKIGVGLFRKKEVADQVAILLGARLSYAHFSPSYSGVYWSASGTDLYTVTPTLAMEYAVSKNFSVGGEVGLEYSEQPGFIYKFDNGSEYPYKTTYKNAVSKTSLVLRYFFN
jgi:hypothetical protein